MGQDEQLAYSGEPVQALVGVVVVHSGQYEEPHP
jgi:hypothetical protein